MSRTCPDCLTPLETRHFQGVMIDSCPKCAGIFFDSGEVLELKRKGVEAMRELEDEIVPTVTVEPSAEKLRQCPSCAVSMEKFRYLYHSNIVLDECDKCGGIWVQDGELGNMSDFLAHQATGHGVVTVVTSAPHAANPTTGAAKYAGRLQRVRQFIKGVTTNV